MSIILTKMSDDMHKIMTARGVPRADFIHSRRDRFDVAAMLAKYETELTGLPSKIVASGKQMRSLEKIAMHPLRSSYTLAICGYPSDQIAKYLAQHLFKIGIEQWQKHHKPGQAMPLWHRVFGGFNDPLRDRDSDENPSMLVISNVNESSSSYKLEKVRDLLERFSHIPRIVVIGTNDPIKFFTTRFHYPLNAGVLLMPTNRIKDGEV